MRGALGRRTDRHLALRRECRTLGSPAATFCREAEPQARRVIASRAGATPLELTSSGRSPRKDAQEADSQPARAYHRNAVRESRGATNLTRARQRRNFPDSFYIPSKLHSRPPTRQNDAGEDPLHCGDLPDRSRATRSLSEGFEETVPRAHATAESDLSKMMVVGLHVFMAAIGSSCRFTYSSARLSVPIGAPRSCPQRGHPALYRASV